jgi:hypothetical protein
MKSLKAHFARGRVVAGLIVSCMALAGLLVGGGAVATADDSPLPAVPPPPPKVDRPTKPTRPTRPNKRLRCKKGYVKKRSHGQTKCIKKKKSKSKAKKSANTAAKKKAKKCKKGYKKTTVRKNGKKKKVCKKKKPAKQSDLIASVKLTSIDTGMRTKLFLTVTLKHSATTISVKSFAKRGERSTSMVKSFTLIGDGLEHKVVAEANPYSLLIDRRLRHKPISYWVEIDGIKSNTLP